MGCCHSHVGGVIVIDGADAINNILHPVYGALGVDFDPTATGALRDQAPDTTIPQVAEAIVDQLEALGEVSRGTLSVETVNAGRELLPDHLVVTGTKY